MGHTPSSHDLNNTRLAITPARVRLPKRLRATGRHHNPSPSIHKGNTGSPLQATLCLRLGSSPATRRNIRRHSSRKGAIPSSRPHLGTARKANPSRPDRAVLLNRGTRLRPAMVVSKANHSRLAIDLPRPRFPLTHSLSRRARLHSDPRSLNSRKGAIRCRPSSHNLNNLNNLQGQEVDLCRLPRRVLPYVQTAGVC